MSNLLPGSQEDTQLQSRQAQQVICWPEHTQKLHSIDSLACNGNGATRLVPQAAVLGPVLSLLNNFFQQSVLHHRAKVVSWLVSHS